jgi:hypothetical protein
MKKHLGGIFLAMLTTLFISKTFAQEVVVLNDDPFHSHEAVARSADHLMQETRHLHRLSETTPGYDSLRHPSHELVDTARYLRRAAEKHHSHEELGHEFRRVTERYEHLGRRFKEAHSLSHTAAMSQAWYRVRESYRDLSRVMGHPFDGIAMGAEEISATEETGESSTSLE